MRRVTGRRPAASVWVFLIGLIMLAAGIIRGEPWRILEFAIIICLECIGIG